MEHGTPAVARLPVEGTMPTFDGATRWLNSPPLSQADLRGKVVLVKVCTYSCINWLRQLPYVRAWSECTFEIQFLDAGVETFSFTFG